MKEDASLIVGVALVALTTRMVWDARWSWSQILCAGLVGAACAVAVSGKYVGIASLVPAIPMLILARKRNWSYWILWPLMFVGCFVVVGATINHRIFDDNWRILPHFENSLEAETEHGLTGHDSVTMPQPNTFSWSVVLSETLLPTKVLICAFGGLLLLVCWRRSLWDWWIAVYAVFWLGVVSYSAIPFHRYSLPPVLLAHVLGGMGAIFLTFLFRNWIWRAAVWVLCFGIIVHFQGGRVMDYLDGFRNDSRDRARHWIARNLPRNSVILSENYAKIVYPGVNLPGYRVQVTRYGPDYGDLRSLERRADYMVVADHTYLRFLEPQVIGEPGYEPIFERRRKWYRDLFESYELLWSTSDEPQMRAFTNPEIRIYKLKGGRKSNDSEPAIRNP
jgi:hypothetical protein